jgi:hypothetical protein
MAGDVISLQIIVEILTPILSCAAGLILHFILYFVFMKKFNFETNVFFYGVGFTSCCFAAVCFAFSIRGPISEHIGMGIVLFYLIPLTFLYYSYAALLEKNEESIRKGIRTVMLFLMAAATVIFAALIVLEIMNDFIPYAGLIPLCFGLYFVYCFVSKKHILSLRAFAWSPFLLAWLLLLYSALMRLSEGII